MDFQKYAEEFENVNDFLDMTCQNGGNEGSGKTRRVNLIKKAMEFGAAKGIEYSIDVLQRRRVLNKMEREHSNGHPDSFK